MWLCWDEKKNRKSKWWNDEVKVAVERQEAALKDMLGGMGETTNENIWKFIKKKTEELKDAYITVKWKKISSLEGRRIRMQVGRKSYSRRKGIT